MAKLHAYPLSILYYLIFGFTLLLFEGIQRICFLFGYQAHKNSVDLLNFLLLLGLNLLGTRFVFEMPFALEKNQSYIVVANHQSTYDIPPLIWYLRKIHPKFVGKKELGNRIPSISFNLKKGGSVLIDRKKVGYVKHVYSHGAGEYLEIKCNNDELLVPFNFDHIEKINLQRARSAPL